MNAEDLKGKTQDELQKILMDLKKEQFNLRFQQSAGQMENTARVRVVRRSVARVKTFMNQLTGKAAPAPAPKAKKAGKKAA